jgi:hypothetical protein
VSVDVDVPSGSTGGGTSVSAPAYNGMLAVLNKLSDDHGSYNFHNYPELTRAIMMAAAANDDGGSFDRLGAGVPSAAAMEKIVKDAQIEFAYFDKSNSNQTYDVYVGETGELRVALVWLTNMTENDFSNNRDAQSDLDLDLYVDDPNGDLLANSLEYDRGFEWVNTSISTTGVYTLDVQKYRWDASETSREMGLAWYVA